MGHLVSDADFKQEVLEAKGPVLVDFWADWCPPCKAMDPILDALSVELDGKVKIVKLDVETNPSTVVTYNVRAMPTLMVFKDGQPVDIKVGYGPSRAQLTKRLEAYACAAKSCEIVAPPCYPRGGGDPKRNTRCLPLLDSRLRGNDTGIETRRPKKRRFPLSRE